MGEHLAQLVVADPADIGGTSAQGGHGSHAVGAGAARHLPGRPHAAVELVDPGLVDQGHDPLVEAQLGDQAVVGMRDHVDDRVAEADHIQT